MIPDQYKIGDIINIKSGDDNWYPKFEYKIINQHEIERTKVDPQFISTSLYSYAIGERIFWKDTWVARIVEKGHPNTKLFK